MKKILLLLLLIVAGFQGFSQTPGISYQAVILNPNTKELPGANAQTSILANSKVAIRFTIMNEDYEQEYQEYHLTKTDAYGMINLLIGHGTRISASYFEDILWNGLSKKLKVDIDFSGTGNNYTMLSEQELTFMPQPALGQDSQAILDNTASILAEVVRATDAESVIQTNLDAIEVESILGDEILQDNIDNVQEDVNDNSSNIGVLTNLTTTTQNNLVLAINEIDLEKANLESPSFTGMPLAPTPLAGTNTTQIATTAFVANAITTAGIPDATATVKGKVQLAGDLTGTAALPTIANAAVTTGKIADDAVTSDKILNANVTSDKLAVDAVTTGKIADGAVTTVKLAAGSVTTDKIADVSVTEGKIASSAITTVKINDGAVVSSKIAASPSFTGIPLAPTPIAGTNTTQIATTAFVTDAIATAETPDATATVKGKVQLAGDLTGTAALPTIANAAVTTVKLAASSVTTGKIADVSVTEDKIASSAVTTGKIADNAVTSDKILNANVTSDKLAADAVTTGKITDGAVTTAKLAASSVTTGKIADVSVTEDKIASSAITTVKINDGAVVSSKIAASPSFTGIPLAPTPIAGTNTTQIATTAFVTDAIATAETPDATATVKGKVQLAGDLTGTAALPTIANAAVTTGKIADDAVTTDKILNANVTSDKLAADAVITDKIADVAVTEDKIAASAITTVKINDGAVVSSKIAASPSFTGIPLAPTAATGTNTTQIATTAFVNSAVSTATASNGNFVTLNSAQTITGLKTFATRKINIFAQSYALTATMNIGFAPNGENLNSIAMGINALYTHHYGARAIAIGNEALYKDLRGSDNIGIGSRTLYNMTDTTNNDWGNRNVAIGSESGTNIIEGDNNTLIGTNTNTSTSIISNSAAIGYQAIVNANNTIQLGNTNVALVNTSGAITSGGAITGTSIVKVGGVSSEFLKADGSVDVTEYAALNSPTFTGIPLAPTATVGTNTTQIATTAFVANAVTTATSGNFVDLTTNQTIAGVKTFSSDAEINGVTVGRGNFNENSNTAIGLGALGSNAGYANTGMGRGALAANVNGGGNTAFGYVALSNNISGTDNVAIGTQTLETNSTGSQNTAIGKRADVASDGISNSVAIGANAIVTASNTIQLGSDGSGSHTAITSVKTSGNITAASYIKSGGTSSEYLMADGSVSSGPSGAVSGSGTSNYLPKFTGASTLGNSSIYDNGTNVGIATNNPSSMFQIGGEGTTDLNLKFDAVSGTSSALKFGFRNFQWRLKMNTNSGTLDPLVFSYFNGTTDVTRLTITNSGLDIPDNLNVTGNTMGSNASFSGNLLVNTNQLSVNTSTNRVGVFTDSPTSMFQIGGDGGFDNPLKYDYGSSEGTLKFGFRNNEFRMKTQTSSGVLLDLIFSYYNNSLATDVESMRITNTGLVTINNLRISGGNPGAGKILTSDANGITSWVAPQASNPVREVADEFSATTSQTSFTLTQTPSVNSKVKMYINGIRISNSAYSTSGATFTYIPANNGGNALTAGDRIQMDYYY